MLLDSSFAVAACQRVRWQANSSAESKNLIRHDLLKILPNTDLQVNYRDRPPFAILPREDPYAMFIYTKLGFRADEVVGQFKREDHSVVLIRQHER